MLHFKKLVFAVTMGMLVSCGNSNPPSVVGELSDVNLTVNSGSGSSFGSRASQWRASIKESDLPKDGVVTFSSSAIQVRPSNGTQQKTEMENIPGI